MYFDSSVASIWFQIDATVASIWFQINAIRLSGTSNARKSLPHELEHSNKGLCVLESVQEMRLLFDGETHDHLRKQVYVIE